MFMLTLMSRPSLLAHKPLILMLRVDVCVARVDHAMLMLIFAL